ncbi:MAG: ComEC family DNA internalization-related competence protein [Clostridia bacterium]|nr:ComEC family DNA internalization-related competence protein [Clostridia bacterium]
MILIMYQLITICRGEALLCPYKNLFQYLKVILKSNIIILLCVSSIISNTYLIYLNKKYESVYKNDTTCITGSAVVLSEKQEKEYLYKYRIKIKSGAYKNKKFILVIKKEEKNIFEYGDLIEFEGEYSAPSKRRNYKGFDYSLYLKSKNIYGTIKTSNCKVLDSGRLNLLLLKSNDIRRLIIKKSNTLLPKESSSLLIGILLGNKEEINEETINNFKGSNLLHLLAVSGAHTSYIILRSNICFKQK